jgi:hypothetical protein
VLIEAQATETEKQTEKGHGRQALASLTLELFLAILAFLSVQLQVSEIHRLDKIRIAIGRPDVLIALYSILSHPRLWGISSLTSHPPACRP